MAAWPLPGPPRDLLHSRVDSGGGGRPRGTGEPARPMGLRVRGAWCTGLGADPSLSPRAAAGAGAGGLRAPGGAAAGAGGPGETSAGLWLPPAGPPLPPRGVEAHTAPRGPAGSGHQGLAVQKREANPPGQTQRRLLSGLPGGGGSGGGKGVVEGRDRGGGRGLCRGCSQGACPCPLMPTHVEVKGRTAFPLCLVLSSGTTSPLAVGAFTTRASRGPWPSRAAAGLLPPSPGALPHVEPCACSPASPGDSVQPPSAPAPSRLSPPPAPLLSLKCGFCSGSRCAVQRVVTDPGDVDGLPGPRGRHRRRQPLP